jgi:hypothetical protein
MGPPALRPFDPVVFGSVLTVLLAAGWLGCVVPALRATRAIRRSRWPRNGQTSSTCSPTCKTSASSSGWIRLECLPLRKPQQVIMVIMTIMPGGIHASQSSIRS